MTVRLFTRKRNEPVILLPRLETTRAHFNNAMVIFHELIYFPRKLLKGKKYKRDFNATQSVFW